MQVRRNPQIKNKKNKNIAADFTSQNIKRSLDCNNFIPCTFFLYIISMYYNDYNADKQKSKKKRTAKDKFVICGIIY